MDTIDTTRSNSFVPPCSRFNLRIYPPYRSFLPYQSIDDHDLSQPNKRPIEDDTERRVVRFAPVLPPLPPLPSTEGLTTRHVTRHDFLSESVIDQTRSD